MMSQLEKKAVRTHAQLRLAKPAKQRGVVLLISLIALVALTLAGIALMRSIDTGNIIAGNIAFKEATMQASDIGVEAALAALPNIISTSQDTNIAGKYFATMQPVDSKGVFTAAFNWGAAATPSTSVTDYDVRYVIERLCQGPLPVTNIQAKCVSDTPLGGGSHKSGAVVFSSSSVVYYRVTVRVAGPRNSVSMIQTILSD